MSSSSAAAKGWGLTVVAATYGFSTAQEEPSVGVLGIALVMFFAILDARYLREERLFRGVYDAARRMEIEVYSMDKSMFDHLPNCQRWTVIASWSVAGFWGPLALVGVGAVVWAQVC